jgi:N-carbamoyl-L-amino-acid hydrolase
VATVGALELEPGVANVVPARVTVSVDARAPTAGQLDALVEEIGFDACVAAGPDRDVGAAARGVARGAPRAPELVSGAGHDAMVLAAAGVPTAMLFVRSLNGGISHSPDELSAGEDVELAVDALTRTWSGWSRRRLLGAAGCRVPVDE